MSDEMTMVERVAKALHEKLCQQDVLGYLSATIDCGELARAATEELIDKIEGLEADLDSAVEVAYRRGATEWVRMNYPAKYAAMKGQEGLKG